MTSLRLYIIVSVLAAITIINFVSVVQGYRSSLSNTEKTFDLQLKEFSRLVLAINPRERDLQQFDSDKIAFQIWSSSGKLLHRSQNAPKHPIATIRKGFSNNNFSNYRWRIYTRSNTSKKKWVMIAERMDLRFMQAENIALQSVLPFIISLPIAGIIIWLIVGSGLSVLRKLAVELSEKRSNDLSPVVATSAHHELSPVIDAINRLFKRLDASFLRERRFSADAAHELKTPISALKTHIHNLSQDIPEQKAALNTIDSDLNRLNHLVEQILILYRTTPEHYKAKMRDIDILELAQDVISDLYPDIEAKQQNIELLGEHHTFTGDWDAVKILMKNLIGNANKYTPDNGDIRILIEKGRQGLFVSVIDSGPGIPESEMQRVFDRFYRVGGDRHSSAVSGCGLGLSIVKHIAELHQAEIDLSKPKGQSGLCICVFFPYELASTSLIDDDY